MNCAEGMSCMSRLTNYQVSGTFLAEGRKWRRLGRTMGNVARQVVFDILEVYFPLSFCELCEL